MKRIRTSKLDEMIDLLESIDPGQGNDRMRRQAINYLMAYADSLGGAKTVKIKEVSEDEEEKA